MDADTAQENTTVLAKLSHHFYAAFESLLLDHQEHFYNPTMFVSKVFLNPEKSCLTTAFACYEMLVGEGVFVDTSLVTEGAVWDAFFMALRELCITYMMTRQHCINTIDTLVASFHPSCDGMLYHVRDHWLAELTEQHLLERELIHQVIVLAVQHHPDVIHVHYREPFNYGVPCRISD